MSFQIHLPIHIPTINMGSHKSKLLEKYESSSLFSSSSVREQSDSKLHEAMVRLFDHQSNMEQSQERYQNQYVHRDVEVITASYMKDPVVLKSLWQVDGSMEVEPITHGLLNNIWVAATKSTSKRKILNMNIHDFEMVVRKFMLENREQSLKTLHVQLQISMQGMRSIFETSLSREERKDEFAKQNADEIRHRLKQAAVWLEWQEESMKKAVNSTFHLFDDVMDQLVVGLLNYFDDQRKKLLSLQNNATNFICIFTGNNANTSKEIAKQVEMFTFAVTSYDPVSKRSIVTYADPNRVPRVESLQLLLARVGIEKVSLSSKMEFKYHDRIVEKRVTSLKKTKKSTRNLLSTLGSFRSRLPATLSSESKTNQESERRGGASEDPSHPGSRDVSGERVIHVEEFCRWFLPAVQQVFTVQNLITESGSAHPDVRSLFPRGNTAKLPSFTDEPDPSWYVDREIPLPLEVPKEDDTGFFIGTLKSLNPSSNEFKYSRDGTIIHARHAHHHHHHHRNTSESSAYEDDEEGGATADSEHRTGEEDVEKEGEEEEEEDKEKASQLYNLSKWQVVEYGIFAFNTTGDMSKTTEETVAGQKTERKTEHHHHHHRKKKKRSTHGDSLTEMPDIFSNDKNKNRNKKVQHSTVRKVISGTTTTTTGMPTPISLPRGRLTNEKVSSDMDQQQVVRRSRSRSNY